MRVDGSEFLRRELSEQHNIESSKAAKLEEFLFTYTVLECLFQLLIAYRQDLLESAGVNGAMKRTCHASCSCNNAR